MARMHTSHSNMLITMLFARVMSGEVIENRQPGMVLEKP